MRLEAPEKGRGGPLGRRSRVVGEAGHPVGDRESGRRPWDVALAATVRAAAPHQGARGRRGPGLVVRREDLRENVREGTGGEPDPLPRGRERLDGRQKAHVRRQGRRPLPAQRRLPAPRQDLPDLLPRRRGAQVLLPPTSSVELAASRLEELPTGGRTPLAAGIEKTAEVLKRERLRDRDRRPLVVLLTDGRATAGPDPLAAAAGLRSLGAASFVVDTEEGYVRLGMAGELAEAMGAPCLRLEELRAESLVDLVERRRVA